MLQGDGAYSLLRPVGSDRPARSSARRVVASTAAGALLATLVVVALSGSSGGWGGKSLADRVRALATSALQEEADGGQAADKYEMYGYGWVSTMRDNVRYPEDLERPYEEAPGYFGEWARVGDSTESLPWQWAGWREAIPTGKFAKMCSWIKFVGQVPPPSHNFGFKLQGNLVNDWVSALEGSADEWHYVHAISHTFEGGDSNNFIMIFDSVPAPAKIQFGDMTLEIYDTQEEASTLGCGIGSPYPPPPAPPPPPSNATNGTNATNATDIGPLEVPKPFVVPIPGAHSLGFRTYYPPRFCTLPTSIVDYQPKDFFCNKKHGTNDPGVVDHCSDCQGGCMSPWDAAMNRVILSMVDVTDQAGPDFVGWNPQGGPPNDEDQYVDFELGGKGATIQALLWSNAGGDGEHDPETIRVYAKEGKSDEDEFDLVDEIDVSHLKGIDTVTALPVANDQYLRAKYWRINPTGILKQSIPRVMGLCNSDDCTRCHYQKDAVPEQGFNAFGAVKVADPEDCPEGEPSGYIYCGNDYDSNEHLNKDLQNSWTLPKDRHLDMH